MKICVIGTGYVGLVTGACLADFGNEVICVDKAKERISSLKSGAVPFHEPGLPEIVARNSKANRLLFTTDFKGPIAKAEIVFITVGTPPGKKGEADISAVVTVANEIAKVIKSSRRSSKIKVIVNKSTVPVGMGDIVTKILLKNKVAKNRFSVVSNPEFLREGSALADFFNPDRIVIGAASDRAFNTITELYRPLNAHIIFTDIKSAELVKYASNAFLATKISFINEIAQICDRLGIDVVKLADAIGLDRRIGRSFLNAGLGYGGSCLPKDVSALTHLARSLGYEPKLISAVNQVNEAQTSNFIEKIEKTLKGVKGKKLAVLGLAFKPETDDLREAPALRIIKALSGQGAKIVAYDPVAEKKARTLLSEVTFCPGIYDALKGVDAVVIATEWSEFRELDFERARKLVKHAVIFDGRNIYDPKKLAEYGFRYFGMGK